MRLLSLYLLLLLLGFSSCQQKSLSIPDYINWVKSAESNMSVSKKIGDYSFTLQYLPIKYRALQEVDNLQSVTKNQLDSITDIYKNQEFFILRISNANETKNMLKTNLFSHEEYQERVQYFSFGLQSDLSLITTELLACTTIHFERSYGLSPYDTFLISFPSTLEKTDKQFVYNDRILGTGPVKFTITKENIDNIPKLILE
ncbi:MAG: hypothetical protein ACI93N_000004 [Flavobacteriaceae bacterium]|jgi:hypothetical protein